MIGYRNYYVDIPVVAFVQLGDFVNKSQNFSLILTQYKLGLAMRLRIHAVHADDPHMRICASRCACKNLDADQPHIEQKRVLQRQILQIHVV